MTTIYDVAKEAGVSPKTVSRVMNGDGPVSVATKELVRTAMDKLGYVPSLAARSIKSRRTGLVGLITGAISAAPDAPEPAGLPDLFIVQGIQTVMAQSGKTLLISDTGRREERVPELIRTFQEYRVEGLFYVADHHRTLVRDIDHGDIPLVLVNCHDQNQTPAVVPNDRDGQRKIVEAVIDAGHRRIGFLTLAQSMVAGQLRLEGYRDALSAAQVPYDPDLVSSVEINEGPGEHQLIWDALESFDALADPPTVLCCGNDRLAVAVYGILRERGRSVPDDISVVGYDNYRLISETLYPALTTMELPYSAMGARAAQVLLDIIQNGPVSEPDAPIMVPGRVINRESLRNLESQVQMNKSIKGRNDA